MLPPGDIRNCIVALSEDEALLSKLFQHRFVKGSGLEGHSFGNLFLAALTSITKDFSEAVRLSSEILVTRGHIYPATTSNVELEALMEDETRVRGETNITASKGRIRELFLVPHDVQPLPPNFKSNCSCGSDHNRARFAFHEPDSKLVGERHRKSNGLFSCDQSLYLQLDDPGQ